MSVVTLSTDFGAGDYAAGLLQGVIWSIAPDAEIIVLSHDIPRHAVVAGARLLERSLPFFPDGTVHICVVDPGVGTQRRVIAARLGSQYFIGPDNGLITLAARQCWEKHEKVDVVRLDKPEYWLEDVSTIFHGRDIFSPVGAHLAQGVCFEQLGTTITDPVWLDLPSAVLLPGKITGQIIHIDHFGNLSTNIHAKHLLDQSGVQISAGKKTIDGMSNTFGDGKPGDLLGLIDSSEHLSICMVNGNAAQALGLSEGDLITVSSKDWVQDVGVKPT